MKRALFAFVLIALGLGACGSRESTGEDPNATGGETAGTKADAIAAALVHPDRLATDSEQGEVWAHNNTPYLAFASDELRIRGRE